MIKMKENKIIVTYEDVISTYKIRKNGEKALSAYMHWFPIKSSIKLAGIIADLMGDGHLQDHPHWRLDYTSNSMEELERFNQEVYSLFGVQGKIRDCTTNQYGTMNLGINPKQLGRVLKLAGVPTGAKVLQEFSIPKWILGDKMLFSRFINRLASCEGCVDTQNKYIELKMHKEETILEGGFDFFNDIKYHLEKYFGIITTRPFTPTTPSIRKDGRKTFGVIIKIKRKDSLRRYKEFIGFENKEKNNKLNKILS